MRTILAVLTCLLTASATLAGPTTVAAVAPLTDRAQVILVGQVSSISAPTRDSSVDVVRVLKGDPGGTTLAVRFAEDVAPSASTSGLLFLERNGDPGVWLAIPIVDGGGVLSAHIVPVAPGSLLPQHVYAPEAAALDKVVSELRNTAEAETDPVRLAQAYRLLFTLERTSDTVVAEHVALLTAATADACPTTKALRSVGTGLADTVRTRIDAGLAVPSSLSSLLCQVVEPTAVPAAGAILSAAGSDQVARRCAANALRNSHSQDSLKHLAAALESSDLEVAYSGVMGLAAYALGDIPGGTGREKSRAVPHSALFAQSPSISAFNDAPPQYIDFWREWWKCQACRLGEPGCDETACEANPGYVATYSAGYDATWTCTAGGPTGCQKNRVTYAPSSFRPDAPDMPVPAAVLYTVGYVATYNVTYEAGWTCVSSGPLGCYKDRLSYSVASYSATGPEAATPAPKLYSEGYATAYAVGSWGACSASCGGGTQFRSVTATSWSQVGPGVAMPSTSQACNTHSCELTCYDYPDTYPTQSECRDAGWPVCERRFRSDGVGGQLTCYKGFN